MVEVQPWDVYWRELVYDWEVLEVCVSVKQLTPVEKTVLAVIAFDVGHRE